MNKPDSRIPISFNSSLSGKQVLITGGLGFIGSNLAHRCLELGAAVVVYDNMDPHSGGNHYNVQDIRNNIKIHYHDILDFDRLVENMVGKDFVFNCAASSSHPFSMREPWLDLDANSRGTINHLEVLRRFNPDAKFIHIGTSTQLGLLSYKPADEKHPEFPRDIYSANKSVSEKYVLIYAQAYNLRTTVIRLANVFGPRATIHSPEFTFNNYFIGLALQGKDISIYGDGDQKRNLLYVDDAIEALLSAALNDQSTGETFFAVSDEHFSITDIAQKIIDVIGKGNLRHIPWPPERKVAEVGDAIISNTKIKHTLGWHPTTGLRSGLEKTRDYYSGCLERYLK